MNGIVGQPHRLRIHLHSYASKMVNQDMQISHVQERLFPAQKTVLTYTMTRARTEASLSILKQSLELSLSKWTGVGQQLCSSPCFVKCSL